jgi:hypothetical protein
MNEYGLHYLDINYLFLFSFYHYNHIHSLLICLIFRALEQFLFMFNLVYKHDLKQLISQGFIQTL